MYNQLVLPLIKRVFYKKSRIAHVIAFTKYNSTKKMANFLFANYERVVQKDTLLSKPYLINSEPTNSSFLKCPFCPTGKIDTRRNGLADPHVYRKILEKISKYVYIITFHGWGEPLMHQNLPSLIEMANKNKICTVVTTNGLLLDKNTSNKLISSKLDVLYVSIDGASEETYQKYRIGGSFEKVFQNIKELVALKKEKNSKTPYIEWQFIVFKHNEHEVRKAQNLANVLGVDNIVFLPAYTENPTFEPTDPKFRLPRYSPLQKRKDCKHLWTTLTFHWDGTVVPCCYDYDGKTTYGNIEYEEWNEIWNNNRFIQSRKIIKNGYLQDQNDLTCIKCIKNIKIN